MSWSTVQSSRQSPPVYAQHDVIYAQHDVIYAQRIRPSSLELIKRRATPRRATVNFFSPGEMNGRKTERIGGAFTRRRRVLRGVVCVDGNNPRLAE